MADNQAYCRGAVKMGAEMSNSVEQLLARWHDYLGSHDIEKLAAQVADDAVFHSPVVHTPQRGKTLVIAYLSAADQVFADADFTYVDQIFDPAGDKAMLEFTAQLDGIYINGVDIIHWNQRGLIQDFKVMVRPLKAVNKLWEKMAAVLEKTAS
ncbi:MAG: nuclear transport factor 2 family protein [Parasphingorhabdus sp.]|nr:nuclear transport factor 2 family protein [Parasphingorhabdus sp.]